MKIALWVFATIGALATAAVFSLAAMAFFGRESNAPASNKKVAFVLNWSGLNSQQRYSVVSSHESGYHPQGDHDIYHCIQLSEFAPTGPPAEGWQPGPEQDPLIAEARRAVAGEAKGCLGEGVDTNGPEVQAWVWSIETIGRSVGAAKIILYYPKNKRLLYVSFET